MRVWAIAVVACLLMIAPAEAGPGSGADCDIQEEYVRDATVSTDPSDPGVEPGAPRLIECYY